MLIPFYGIGTVNVNKM